MKARTGLPRATWLAGAAAVMPALAFAAGPGQIATAGAAFVPPAQPMVLTRTLQRALPDGKQIVTRRRYEIRFAPDGNGYRVDGTLLSADADAPPALEMLAALERARPDIGLFPMRIDGNGVLLHDDGDTAAHAATDAPPHATVVRSARLTSSALAAAGLPKEDILQSRRFVDGVGRSGARTRWPADLFRPAAAHRRETLLVPLPGGKSGQVDVEQEAKTAGTGLVTSFRRMVTTELDGTTRRTTEIWTLEETG